MNSVSDFIDKYGIGPETINPHKCAEAIISDMEKSLNTDDGDMAMIPTYLSSDGALPAGSSAVIIDAGGTNFRCALVCFNEGGYQVSQFRKSRMPGADRPATWEEFISFTAEQIAPLMTETDYIGFCFSYEADITPERDGRVVTIDKEVKVTGAKGRLLGKCLIKELEKRGVRGKKVVILNDTVAVLLGGTSGLDKSGYSGFVGQVSGTGTNTCCVVPENRIGKIGSASTKGMIVNMESGSFGQLPRGILDERLDGFTGEPGLKYLEKMTAGVYLGKLAGLAVEAAVAEGLISSDTLKRVRALGEFDTSVVDAWSRGEEIVELASSNYEAEFFNRVSRALIMRSAVCMSSVLLAIAKFTGAGTSPEKPLCDCAEGSLVQKCALYRETLEKMLEGFKSSEGVFIELRIVSDSTISGSAAAAILNA